MAILVNHPIAGQQKVFTSGSFNLVHNPAANTKATITVTNSSNFPIILTSFRATLSAGATAAAPVAVTLIDGVLTTVLFAANLACPVNGKAIWEMSHLYLFCANTFVLAFAAAGGATTVESVAINGRRITGYVQG